MQTTPRQKSPPSELRQALVASGDALVATLAFSIIINLLMLVSPIYMLQIYDRVLVSRSEATLLVLTLIALLLIAVMGALESVRGRVLVRLAGRLDLALGDRIVQALFRRGLNARSDTGAQGLRDFEQVRTFVTGPSLIALLDTPWVPLMVAILFALHWALGVLGLVSALALALCAWATHAVTARPLEEAGRVNASATNFVETSLRNAEAAEAMGMFPNLRRRWFQRRAESARLQALASDRGGGVSGLTKALRIGIQTLALALGALLAIEGEISAGVIIAASTILGRALAPIEMWISTYKQSVQAAEAWRRLDVLLREVPPERRRTRLPRPQGHLSLEGVAAAAPGTQAPILGRIGFDLPAGRSLAIIGPNGSGKSSLARVIAGVWRPLAGSVRLDGADLTQWNREELGPWIGYLPQDIELFDGTIAENIARFGPPDDEKLVAAARAANLHETILRLPQGYDTQIGPGGAVLSVGQRQRVGLARALYGDPVLLVLDEPNAALDEVGERALVQALEAMRADGRTLVMVTHRPALVALCDLVCVLARGTVAMLGPPDEVVPSITRPSLRGPVTVTADGPPTRPPRAAELN